MSKNTDSKDTPTFSMPPMAPLSRIESAVTYTDDAGDWKAEVSDTGTTLSITPQMPSLPEDEAKVYQDATAMNFKLIEVQESDPMACPANPLKITLGNDGSLCYEFETPESKISGDVENPNIEE
ncbi:MAG: hypothetical protein KA998_00805 [Rickettsiaceae bacterium]|nr:hypothetical protein [Rickettsiaceae bacterium]